MRDGYFYGYNFITICCFFCSLSLYQPPVSLGKKTKWHVFRSLYLNLSSETLPVDLILMIYIGIIKRIYPKFSTSRWLEVWMVVVMHQDLLWKSMHFFFLNVVEFKFNLSVSFDMCMWDRFFLLLQINV